MAEQARISKSKSEAKRVAELEKVEAAKNAEAEQAKADADELLDNIDDVLEENDDALWADIDEALGENIENAQEFVAGFQQKGGQ